MKPGVVRLVGPASYRGWVVLIDTFVGPQWTKRWTMGHHFWACVIVWLGFALRLRRTWRGEPVLFAKIAFIDRSEP